MPKSYSELLPSVDRRLTAWISVLDRRPGDEVHRPRPTITISRKFGCEAFPLCERLQELLTEASGESWNIFDKALLERVSQDEHLSIRLLEDLGGRSRSADAIGSLLPGHVTHDEAFRRLARHVISIAQAGNALIVGRGGAIIAARLQNCYHFRLDASARFCIETTMRRLGVSEKEAAEMVRECDGLREAFIEDSLHASVRDVGHYHAVFNRDRSSIEEIAHTIVGFVARSWQDKSYFKARHATV